MNKEIILREWLYLGFSTDFMVVGLSKVNANDKIYLSVGILWFHIGIVVFPEDTKRMAR